MDNQEVYERYYNLSLRYLSYRPRSEKEVYDYLKGKQFKAKSLTDQIISKIIKKLKEYNFIDDVAFTKFWINQRIKYKNKPLRVVKYELKQKGINQDLINICLNENDQSRDLESAQKLANKKMDFYRNLPSEKKREKVMRYLIGKGFSYEVVKKALKH